MKDRRYVAAAPLTEPRACLYAYVLVSDITNRVISIACWVFGTSRGKYGFVETGEEEEGMERERERNRKEGEGEGAGEGELGGREKEKDRDRRRERLRERNRHTDMKRERKKR